jgi:drug/metabolite transporter (DMT)-like permease
VSTDLGLLLMALIWGVNFPVIKVSLDELSPLAFNGLRFSLASLTVLGIVGAKGWVPWPDRQDWARVIFLGLLGNVVYQGFFIFGIDATFAGNAAILLATIPLWTLILSTLLGHERPGPMVWTGVLVALVGMVLVVLGGEAGVNLDSDTFRGDLLIVGAALTWSMYTVGSRNLLEKYGSLPVTAWTLWIGSVGLILLGIPSLLQTPILSTSSRAWIGVGYAGILAIGLAYLLWYRGVQRIGSSRTAVYQNLTPVVALVVAWIWLGETPLPLQLAGASAVLAGLALARVGRDRNKQPAEGR